MTVIARKLSTQDTLVYDEDSKEIYLIDSTRKKITADENILQFARRMNQGGHAVCLNQMQMDQLQNRTQHIAFLT